MLLRLPLKKNKSFFLFSIYPSVALILFHLRRHTCHFAPIFTAPCCSSVAATAASCEAPISSEVHLGWPRAELVGLRALGSKARGLTADDHLAAPPRPWQLSMPSCRWHLVTHWTWLSAPGLRIHEDENTFPKRRSKSAIANRGSYCRLSLSCLRSVRESLTT